jgi:hypothetical protein
MKQITIQLLILIFCIEAQSQESALRYQASINNFNIYDMTGLRQSLSYQHFATKKIGLRGTVYLASGRGKDVSGEFEKNYVLAALKNLENTPIYFRGNRIPGGLVNFDRIAQGLVQDKGFFIQMVYSLYQNKKLSSNLALGYGKSFLEINYRESVIKTNVSSSKIDLFGGINIEDLIIPLPVMTSVRNALVSLDYDITYRLNENIDLGLSCYTMTDFDVFSLNNGIGLLLKLNL